MSLPEAIDHRNADKWLKCNGRATQHLPLAVCMDIDSTILHEKTKKIMPNCLQALQHLKSEGITVFIITARSENIRVETINELKDEGIAPDLYKGLLMNNGDEAHDKLKAAHRKDIRKTHCLIMAIGDRIHDLIGLYESDEAHYNLLLESLHQYCST